MNKNKKIFQSINSALGKFNNFSVPQNLREIDFGDSRSAKSTTFTHLEALNFEFLQFLKAEIHKKITKFRAPKITKTAI